jgi:MFS family permease
METSSAQPVLEAVATPAGEDERIVIYFCVLTALIGFAVPGGLAALPVAFHLKDHVHLDAEGLAIYGLITNIPVLIAFVFGFIRDRRIFGLRDRGFMAAGAALAVLCYMSLAAGSLSYIQLVVTLLLASCGFQMVSTSLQASMTIAGKQRMMTGKLSGLTYAAFVLPQVVTAVAGGWLATHVSPRVTFILVSLVTCAIVFEAFRPTLEIAEGEPTRSSFRSTFTAAGAMLRERSLRIVVVILFVTAFSPGWVTPLLYFFTSHLKMTSEGYGIFIAVLFALEAVGAAAYAILCKRMTLEQLLWFSTVLNVAVTPLPYWLNSESFAMLTAAAAGLAFGIANAAYFDLLMRSCPRDMEGTGRMLGFSAFFFAQFSSDILGSALYQHNGFGLCMILSTIATALVFPLLLLIPRTLISTRDGETLPIS